MNWSDAGYSNFLERANQVQDPLLESGNNQLTNGSLQGTSLIINLDESSIISRDTFTNRVLIKNGAIKISKQGVDVLVAQPADLLLNQGG